MSQLINDLLALSRVTREEMARQPVNLSAIVEEVERSLREADPDRHITFSIEPEVMADADPRLVRLALENLIGNAWKFTGKREQASIAFGIDRGRRPRVYYVRDNGAGFDMKHASQLFQAFQRLHVDDFDGTGIGLAIVQRVMMRHGGRAWAESVPDQGATFYFTLPKSRTRETAAR
jgi:light-regulated signal transduction histidine kinase (bacteriophytochrome)